MEKDAIVEAALFCAGRPMKAKEIAEGIGLTLDEVKDSLSSLVKIYSSASGAIEVVKMGKKHVMQLRGSYAKRVMGLAEARISKDLLKTATLIAYHQPILQSHLRKMVGQRTYDHVKELKEMNLILTRTKGNSLELTTSKSFPNYFGIDATNREDLRKWFQEQAQGASP
ncbi:MAG: SMC-Scp complex subunit ScpB [Thermoplasmata archaeon]